jgi:hypothetical protein
MRIVRASFVIVALLVALTSQSVMAATWTSTTFIPGNPSCSGGTKIDPVADGTYAVSFDGFAGSITIDASSTPAGPVFSFATDNAQYHVVTSVLVKGGPNALLYTYSPGVSSDSGLHSNVNPNNGKYYGLSHLCFFTAKLSG